MRYLKKFVQSHSHTHTQDAGWLVLVICLFCVCAATSLPLQFGFVAVVDSCARLYVLGWECNFQWSQVFEKYPIWRQMFVFYFDILERVFAYKTATPCHTTPKLSSLSVSLFLCTHCHPLHTHPSHKYLCSCSLFSIRLHHNLSFFQAIHAHTYSYAREEERERGREQEHSMKSGSVAKSVRDKICVPNSWRCQTCSTWLYQKHLLKLYSLSRSPLLSLCLPPPLLPPKSFYICALTPFTHGSTSWRGSTGASNRIYGQLFMCHRNNSNNTTVNREKWLSHTTKRNSSSNCQNKHSQQWT